MASLAAKRAASDACGRDASAGVKSRSRSAGRAPQRLLEAVEVDHVDADPDDHGRPGVSDSFDRDGLGEVARLVHVVAHPGGQLAGEQLEGHHRDDRLEQGRHLGQADQLVGVRGDGLVTLLDQHDRVRAAGPDLLDGADHLLVQLVAALRAARCRTPAAPPRSGRSDRA